VPSINPNQSYKINRDMSYTQRVRPTVSKSPPGEKRNNQTKSSLDINNNSLFMF